MRADRVVSEIVSASVVRSDSNPVRVAVIQDGARRRYAVPRALREADILERAFIDWFLTPGSLEERLAALVRWLRPRLAAKMAERRCPSLSPAQVVRNPWLALRAGLAAGWHGSREAVHQAAARRLSRWVLRQGFGRANALYAFVRNVTPEVFAAARRRGLKTVGDQVIAPAAVERAEMQEQLRRWPGWQPDAPSEIPDSFRTWEERSWEELDHLTCMSAYVRDGLIAQGISADRITVIEYPLDAQAVAVPDRARREGVVTVGFVGAVGLRKGAPYVFEVARRCDPRRVRFVMVGPVRLAPLKVAAHRGHVELTGGVPRSQVLDWLTRFDIFFFPTTCEGSAGSVMEAMASGLPVVTTPNSGTVARDGIEGFLAPYWDLDRFTGAIGQLVEDRNLRLRMGQAARRRIEAFGEEWYSQALAGLFRRLLT